jgi:hypothetical protein
LSEPEKEVSSNEEMNLPADSDEKLLIRRVRSDDGDTSDSENDSIKNDGLSSNDGSDNDDESSDDDEDQFSDENF